MNSISKRIWAWKLLVRQRREAAIIHRMQNRNTSFQNSSCTLCVPMFLLACKQTHLFGVSCEYLAAICEPPWYPLETSLRLSLHGTGSKRIQMDPVRKSDRIVLLFTRDRSETGPERIQTDPELDLLFYRCNFGSVWIRSGPVPERSRVWTEADPVRFGSERFRSGPV